MAPNILVKEFGKCRALSCLLVASKSQGSNQVMSFKDRRKVILLFTMLLSCGNGTVMGLGIRCFGKKNSSTKTNKALFAVDIQISCNGNFIDIAFWHRYLTLSKSLTLASFAVSFVSFYAFAAVFSLFVDALSTNWST